MALGARAKGVTGYDFAAPYNDLINKSGDLNNVGAKRRRQLRSRQSSFTSSVAGGRPSHHVARVASPQIPAKPEIACTGCRMVRQRRRSVRAFFVGHCEQPVISPGSKPLKLRSKSAELRSSSLRLSSSSSQSAQETLLLTIKRKAFTWSASTHRKAVQALRQCRVCALLSEVCIYNLAIAAASTGFLSRTHECCCTSIRCPVTGGRSSSKLICFGGIFRRERFTLACRTECVVVILRRGRHLCTLFSFPERRARSNALRHGPALLSAPVH